MNILSADAGVADKITFISGWLYSSWGDDSDYYRVSEYIWVFLLDEKIGVCHHSESIQCKVLTFYWIFIATLNIVLTFPLSHVAAVYDWYMG